MSDPYRVLQVSVSADAGEIRRSFHALIRKVVPADKMGIHSTPSFLSTQYHPDKTASGKTAVGESDAGADWFHEVTKAYRILSDPKLRREFDSKSTGGGGRDMMKGGGGEGAEGWRSEGERERERERGGGRWKGRAMD